MTIDKDIAKSSKVLRSMSEQSLLTLETLMTRKEYAAGTVVFAEGDSGDDMYFIERGVITISKAVEGEIETPLATFGPGQCFGEMSLIDRSPRSATAKTQDEAVMLVLTRDDFERYLQQDPLGAAHFLMGVLWEVNERLRNTDELLRDTIYWGMRAGGQLSISGEGE